MLFQIVLFSAGETDLVLRRLLEFFDDEGLRGMRTSDCERWKRPSEEKEGRVREGEAACRVWGGLMWWVCCGLVSCLWWSCWDCSWWGCCWSWSCWGWKLKAFFLVWSRLEGVFGKSFYSVLLHCLFFQITGYFSGGVLCRCFLSVVFPGVCSISGGWWCWFFWFKGFFRSRSFG